MISYRYLSPMSETQVLFRVEEELLEALDRVLSAEGFKTRNEWFRAQVRRALEDAKRRRAAGLLERLTVEGVREDDLVAMVREWRSRKVRR
jgi:metal-responsive CopG/Arc/MetJ family transcriptional regulator